MKSRRSWTPRLTVLNALFAAALFCTPLHALEFTSGAQQTQLIELYTSEGCSSCPPADRWLSQFKTSTQLWQDFVPVAYHVDYWDYIGWKDRFADPSHAARQRQHAAVGNLDNVYTPGFVVDGMEWRGWFKGQQLPARVDNHPGTLSGHLNENILAIEFEPRAQHKQLIVTVALLGTDLVSEVNRGENANRTLKHDFAVLDERSIVLDKGTVSGKFVASVSLPSLPEANALAVWVSSGASLRPLQAAGAWLVEGQ